MITLPSIVILTLKLLTAHTTLHAIVLIIENMTLIELTIKILVALMGGFLYKAS
jgi:hypothetical protein